MKTQAGLLGLLIFLFFQSRVVFAQLRGMPSERDSVIALQVQDHELDFTKLQALIGNKKIVLLGEQSHGDGSSFRLKTEFIKFLHREMGFDVIIFESDFFAFQRLPPTFETPSDFSAWIKDHQYPFWADTPPMEELWNYVYASRSSPREIIVAGIDSRHIGAYTGDDWWNMLQQEVAIDVNGLLGDRIGLFLKILNDVMRQEDQSRTSYAQSERDDFLTALEKIKNEIQAANAYPFWEQELGNLINYVKDAWQSDFFPLRNRQMGENLIWLLEHRFKGQKVIIWSHNQHIMKDRGIEVDLLKKFDPTADVLLENPLFTEFGQIISRFYPEQVFSIGMLSYDGAYSVFEEAVIQPRKYDPANFKDTKRIQPASAESLEHELGALDQPYLYIDLSIKKELLFPTKALKNHHPQGEFTTRWQRAYDGFFFIRTMEPLFGK